MRKLSLLLPFIAALFLVSCGKEESSQNNASPLVEITSSESYSSTEFVAAVSQGNYFKSYFGDNATLSSVMDKALNLLVGTRSYTIDTVRAKMQNVSLLRYKRDWQVETHTFYYRSISSFGEPIMLSGRVSFPNAVAQDGHEVKTLSIVNHYFVDDDVVPGFELSGFSLRALYNSAVIEPDFQGYGVARGYSYCGFSYDVEARQMADCLFAALEIMRQHGVRLADDGHTTLWGYSIVMPAAVAFMRYYDEQMTAEQRDAIRLKSAFVGGGPMLMDRLLQNMDSELDYDASLLRLVFPLIGAIPEYQFGGYALKELVPEWMHEVKVNVDGQQYTFYDAMMKRLPGIEAQRPSEYTSSKLKNNFAAEVCNDKGHLDYSNAKTKVIMDLFHRLSDWGDWMPSADIYITHSLDDNRMPYNQDKEFYDSKKACGKLHWKDIHSGVGGLLYGDDGHSAATLDATISTILYEEPANAWRNAQ